MKRTKLYLILFIAFLLLLLSGAARGQTVNGYVQEFQRDAQTYKVVLVRDSPFIIETVEELYMFSPQGKMHVDAYADHVTKSIYFNTQSDIYINELKVLVYHELGHYYLKRFHNNNLRPDGSPVSIMNTIYDIDWGYLSPADQTYYTKELFGIKY